MTAPRVWPSRGLWHKDSTKLFPGSVPPDRGADEPALMPGDSREGR